MKGRVSSPRVIDGVLTGFTPQVKDQDGDPHSYQMRALLRMKDEAAIENILHQQRLQHASELAIKVEGERQKAKIRRASAPTTRKPTRTSHRPTNAVDETKRQIIRELSSMNFEGAEYCVELDKRKAPVPQAWLQQGCPRSYVQAYKLPKWKQRINDEKYRMTKK